MDDLTDLLTDFRRHLTARNRAPRTIADYLKTGAMFVAWLTAEGRSTDAQKIRPSVIEAWLVFLAEKPCDNRTGKTMSAASVAHHYRNLQQLFKYLVKDDILEKDPFAKLSPPAVPEHTVPVLTATQIKALLSDCAGTDFLSRRDHAMIRLLADTGMRCSELIGIKLEDLDFETDTVLVMGKGRRPRIAPFGAKTGDAVRRYMRIRKQHPKAAATDALFIGHSGPVTDSGVRQILERRGNNAGIAGVHPHRLRHTFAHEWLSNGGGEVDLMSLAGWKSRQMVQRYGASAAAERARTAHKRAAIGDRY